MSFGENVGYYRRQLNITQEELAERLFVSRQTVSRWETDSTFPDVEMIIRLCELFDCNMDTLVRGNAQEAGHTCEGTFANANGSSDTIEKMKAELKSKRLLNERIMGGIAGTLALVTVLAYLLCGFLGGLWHPMWLLFVGFGVLCGISAIVIDAVIGVTDTQKKIRAEKKKIKNKKNGNL